MSDVLLNMDVGGGPGVPDSGRSPIYKVWKGNLLPAFRQIRDVLARGYTYVALDTEFPGFGEKPDGEYYEMKHCMYQTVRRSCDASTLIQCGLTFMDKHGHLHPGTCTWQFNFQFDLSKDRHDRNSIEFLMRSGIPFNRLITEGIDLEDFVAEFIRSNLMGNSEITWITFQGCTDFGYLVKEMKGTRLPALEVEFVYDMKIRFPFNYDMKVRISLIFFSF